MRVNLKRFNDDDAIIVIGCECGNRRMLDEAGEFKAENLFVYRHGVPVKNLRCSPSEEETLSRAAQGKPQCRERYRIILHEERDPQYLEIAHLSPWPREEVLETQTIQFPASESRPEEPMYPPNFTVYVNKPYG
jgi:hypothetical protein